MRRVSTSSCFAAGTALAWAVMSISWLDCLFGGRMAGVGLSVVVAVVVAHPLHDRVRLVAPLRHHVAEIEGADQLLAAAGVGRVAVIERVVVVLAEHDQARKRVVAGVCGRGS